MLEDQSKSESNLALFFCYLTIFFYNFLKNKEWKIKIDKTGQMLIDFFKAELGHGKRYPKKPTQKKSNNPVRCVKISMSNFKKEENEIEILPMKSKKDIL